MRTPISMRQRVVASCFVVIALAALAACSDEDHLIRPPTSPGETVSMDDRSSLPDVPGALSQETLASTPPSELVTVSFGEEAIELWPYTGAAFDGTPSDPVNLLFVGHADPLQIRSALVALDGDRSAFGFPDVYPFNATWSEASGDVQTNYAGEEGWTANYVQLQLGVYEPARAHLRLFETASPFGDGVWTVGAAHFEILIPGTADHQVIQWELAEQLITVDMLRSGLLDTTVPMLPSGVINAAPTFREIPAVIYNGLPPELQALILGPDAPPQVSDPVGIPTDGQATIFHLAQAAPIVPGLWEQGFTLTYEQVIPKPFCNDGTEYVLVTGPVTFQKNAQVFANGRYRTSSRYEGLLTITPWDILNNEPAGPSYPAEVRGTQSGTAFASRWTASSKDSRLAIEPEGRELLATSLRLVSGGAKIHLLRTHCLED